MNGRLQGGCERTDTLSPNQSPNHANGLRTNSVRIGFEDAIPLGMRNIKRTVEITRTHPEGWVDTARRVSRARSNDRALGWQIVQWDPFHRPEWGFSGY